MNFPDDEKISFRNFISLKRLVFAFMLFFFLHSFTYFYCSNQLSKIEDLLSNSDRSSVTVYRLGEHIDVTDGPLIPSTSQMFHFVVTAVSSICKCIRIETARFSQIEHLDARLVSGCQQFLDHGSFCYAGIS